MRSTRWPGPGLIIAAPRSGSGKTVITLGLMRALAVRGLAVAPLKCGPDYIDPAFHGAAARRASVNIDTWAMSEGAIRGIVAGQLAGADIAIAEGLMGLFDGVTTLGAAGTGATADLAALTGWPVLLVLDVTGQSQTAAAVALGCARLREGVRVAGVIANKVGSARHARLVRGAIEGIGLPLLGAVPREADAGLPERHLGLVQAGETHDLEARIEGLAALVESSVDVAAVAALAMENAGWRGDDGDEPGRVLVPAPGQRIGLAQDAAFSFIYPHVIGGWRRAGAEILPFSPLNDEAPDPSCDCVWLPGGYPELHGGRLAAATRFLDGVRAAARRGPVHGECGGFMVLGDGLESADGVRHAMAGLLGLETSFAKRRLHLGYRRAVLLADCALGPEGTSVRGHEFHYASVLACRDEPLAALFDADGQAVAERGARRGAVTGSFFHAIARS